MNSLTTTEPGVVFGLVDRVSTRMATGVPLIHALAGENVSLEDYQEHLREHPELAALEGVAKRNFMQKCVGILLAAKDSSANVRWLLERLYPEVFGLGLGRERERDEADVAVNVTAIAGMSMEEVRLLREDAKRL